MHCHFVVGVGGVDKYHTYHDILILSIVVLLQITTKSMKTASYDMLYS